MLLVVSDRMLAATTLKSSLEKVLNLINHLDISEGSWARCIPAVLLCNCAVHLIIIILNAFIRKLLAFPISIIYNRSPKGGVFPEIWKKTCIILIFKSVDKVLVKNYRPVFSLSTVPKLFEKIVYLF